MNFRIRNVALLFLVLVLAAGLASAQTGPGVRTTDSTGKVTDANFDGTNGGPVVKAPTGGANNTYKYWDVLGTGGTSTNYFSTPPYITQPPNPQVAVGPDDILTIVNRTIARYPNINAGTSGTNAVGVTNPYFNPPTEYIWLDTWLGLIGNTALQSVCPSGTGNNGICIIDNASVRYDQMQGRFVVLFTVTDIIAHRSNFIVIVSKFSQFTKCTTTQPTCPAASPLFSAPVIAPVVGGTQTGGINSANWFAYVIPINLTYVRQPVATAGVGNGSGLGTGLAGTPNSVSTGGGTVSNFITTLFCPNGGAALPLTPGVGGTLRSCTNYFPTGARMGLDNDNIILTAPVLDSAFAPSENTLPITPGQQLGPYAGTRVVTLAKMIVYNGGALNLTSQPPACDNNSPIDCTAVNLADNTVTGTLTVVGASRGTTSPVLCLAAAPAAGVCEATAQVGPGSPNPINAVYWEPANLRGRSLASFDAQVAPLGTAMAGVITPITYLVGRRIYDANGANTGTGASGVDANYLLWIQPLVFTCPAANLLLDPIKFCGSNGSVVADQPALGPLFTNTASIALTTNANTVGQGFSAASMTTNPANTPVSSTVNSRLFVGDSRPLQVMFREGLLYEARTARVYDSTANALSSSTVAYDLIRTCATSAAVPTCSYSVAGGSLASPFLLMETEWFNGQLVNPANDIAGFGFYAPMFDSPANVINSGPTSPISLFPWLEKLFVGMTTGGTANVAQTFSKSFPSLWDFRPGDDAYDTVQPYIDPYTGLSTTTVPCGNNVTVTVLSKSGNTITVADTTGLAVGQYLTSTSVGTFPATITAISGNVVTLSSAYTGTTFPTTLTFSLNQPGLTLTASQITAGSNVITLSSTAGLQIGSTIASANTDRTATTFGAGSTTLLVTSTANIGVGSTVTGRPSSFTTSTVAGSTSLSVPNTTQIAVGGTVCSPASGGLCAGSAAGLFPAGGATVTAIVPDPANAGRNLITLSAAATTTNSSISIVFDATNLIAAGTVVNTAPNVAGQVGINNATAFASGPCPGGAPAPVWPAGTCPTATSPLGAPGVTVRFTSTLANFFGAGVTPTVINISGNNVTLSAPAVITSNNVSFTFTTTNTTCPMIQWSVRGGASTDPNDGSLWLFGAFAKNRFASIPGPGQWGTSVANYALDFPATDAYNNDNSFFGDVAPGSGFFTWIQIAKNLALAQPSALGPCPTSPAGSPPVLQPPAPGTTPTPAPSTLQCPFFNPTAQVTRAEMAYWVIRSQMDDAMVTAFLAATGGDPTASTTTYSFGDATPAGITNPFLANPGAGFQGVTSTQLARYIEVMVRRGYTKGKGICTVQGTTDAVFRYCPNDLITRGEMAVFLIRAKMNNVFPTSLSGLPAFGPYGDNFGLFQQSPSYFTDVTSASDFYIYIQKMRELRITNGTGSTAYSPNNPLTRQEIATFVVRAFFL